KETPLPKELARIVPLSPHDCRMYFIENGQASNILDAETGLIDNQLIKHFNAVNEIYEQMRDVEWEQRGCARLAYMPIAFDQNIPARARFVVVSIVLQRKESAFVA